MDGDKYWLITMLLGVIEYNINNMVKKVISFTIDENLLGEWKDYARSHSINSSLFIEDLLRKYLEDKI